jgi:hypothetical protein
MYEGSHTAAFNHTKAEPVANMQKYYSGDGYDEEVLEFEAVLKATTAVSDTEHSGSNTCTEAEGGGGGDSAADYPPYCAILEPGDMLFFDTKIAHHGLANTSLLPRSLLCFAFQQPDHSSEAVVDSHDAAVTTSGSLPSLCNAPKVEGFTYHCHNSMTKENITLEHYSTNINNWH